MGGGETERGEREAASQLTTIISDGSKVMHSQPRLPPSCLPKLQRETKQVLKQTDTEGEGKIFPTHRRLAADAADDIRAAKDERQHYVLLNRSNRSIHGNQGFNDGKCEQLIHVDLKFKRFWSDRHQCLFTRDRCKLPKLNGPKQKPT